jgi:hypothetical protein
MKFDFIFSFRDEENAKRIRLQISNGTHKFSTKRYNILDLDNLTDANKVEFKFVKDNNIKDKDKYFIRVIENTKDLIMFDKDLVGFTTYKILGGCLNQITQRFLEILKANLLNIIFHPDETGGIEILKFRFNIYFGRELFSNIEKEYFTPREWIKHRSETEKNIPSFHHFAPQFLKKLPKLQGEFKFQLEEKEETKGKVQLYFDHGIKRRMATLKYTWEDSLWKLTELRDTNILGKLAYSIFLFFIN